MTNSITPTVDLATILRYLNALHAMQKDHPDVSLRAWARSLLTEMESALVPIPEVLEPLIKNTDKCLTHEELALRRLVRRQEFQAGKTK